MVGLNLKGVILETVLNKVVTSLLRKKFGFEGSIRFKDVVCTTSDDNISIELKADINANGADILNILKKTNVI